MLLAEGTMLHRLITRSEEERAIGVLLGYPLGVFINALVFFSLHLLHIPFNSYLSVFGAHGILIATFFTLLWRAELSLLKNFPVKSLFSFSLPKSPLERVFFFVALLFLIVILLTSFVTAATLPMFYWDSFSHWALRSKVTLDAGSFVTEGVIQPQYPILFHSIQMLFSLSQFRDQVVNTATFLLSLTSLCSLFLFVRDRRDSFCALILLMLLTGIPLIAIHLRQGMGDIHILLYVLLSAMLLEQALTSRERSAFLLSAIFVSASAWAKYEGLYFGVLPWLAIVSIDALRNRSPWENIRFGILPALLLTIPWPLLTLLRGLNLSAHGGSLAFHPEAIPLIFEQLFTLGSFGIIWWVITLLLPLLLWFERRRLVQFFLEHPVLFWGCISFILLLGVYIFTNDVRGLIHRDNFSRAMLLPALLFTYAIGMEGYKRFYSPHPNLSRSVS